MQEYSPLPRVLRFGVFEADLRSRELRKHGLKIKLQEKPFHVLAILLERQGELVTREELQHALWPADTFVDFDTNLNAAINKLREALGDSAGSSRFIETLPRLGYRFMVPVDGVRAALVPAQQAHLQEVPLPTTKGAVPKPPLQKRWALALATAVLAVLAAGSWWLVVRRKPGAPPVIAILPFKNLIVVQPSIPASQVGNFDGRLSPRLLDRVLRLPRQHRNQLQQHRSYLQ